MLTPPGSSPTRTAASVLDRSSDASSNAALPYTLSQSLVRYPLYYSKLSSLLSSLPVTPASGSKDVKQSAVSGNTNKQAEIQRTFHAALLEAIKLGDYMSLQSLLISPPLRDGNNNSNNGVPVSLVNHHDSQTGLTPLHNALRTRPLPSIETIKILYQAGADMNAQSHYGRTALHHLCRFSPDHALAPSQDDTPANNNSTSNPHVNGTTVSSTSGSTVMEGGRKKNRYRTNTNGSGGSNHLTDGKAQPGSSAASITSSNDPSSKGSRHDSKSASPQDVQRASEHLAECCRLLLCLGSLVNIQDRHGNTPLHFAVEYGGVPQVVNVLVQAGADSELRNMKGLKPSDVIRAEQSEEIRRILGKQEPIVDTL